MIRNTANIKETKNLNPELVNAIMAAGQLAIIDGGLAKLTRVLMANTHDLNDYYVKREAYDEDTHIVETEQLGIIHLVTACSSDDIFYYISQIPGLRVDLNYVYVREKRADFSDNFRTPPRATEKTNIELSLSPAEYAISLGRYDRAAMWFAYGSSINVNNVKRILRSDTTLAQALRFVRQQLPDNEETRRTFDWNISNPTPPANLTTELRTPG